MRRFSLVAVIAAIFMSADVFACTTAIVGAGASASGKPMIWKQRDASNPENVLVYIAPSGGNYGYTAIFNYNDLKRRSAYAGANEKGFAIINNLSSNLASTDYDVSNGSIMRIALEKCASVADFERLLHETEPKTFESNFAVLDASGVAAYFEA
ncbi:MAG: hypothetical protein HUJ95_05550, partial [Bacteroidales bacterium]|nr:hypothetical protein [Bacteroidales bacterium]